MSNTTNTPANIRKAGKANTPAKTTKAPAAPAQLTEGEISQVLREYSPVSMSQLRKLEGEISARFGKSNWISIRARYQSKVKEGITSATDGAIEAAKDYDGALVDSFRRVSVNSDFVKLAEYINVSPEELAKNWPTGAAFVAATYPNTINGAPARRVSYVRKDKETGRPSYVVDTYELAALTAASVPGVVSACIRNIAKAARAYVGKISEIAPRIETEARKAGAVVGAYSVSIDKETGEARKGEAVSPGILAAIAKEGVKALETLTDYNRKAREAAPAK